jgi:anti-anti-sigma factor
MRHRHCHTVGSAVLDTPNSRAAPLALSHRVVPTDEVIVDIGGELDIATKEMAVSYVTDIIDNHHGPVIVNVTGLEFCDAQGLSALLRMANYAEQTGHPFILASPGPPLLKIMQSTGVANRFLPRRWDKNSD